MGKNISFVKKNIIQIFLVIIFLSFLAVNLNMVYFSDDIYFLHYTKYNFIEHISKLGQFYFETNGRFIIHFLLTWLLKLPLIYMNIINSLIITRNMLFCY